MAPVRGPGPRSTRGYLNNNPGNMDRSKGEPWQGEVRDYTLAQNDVQHSEMVHGRFCVFASPEWGYRAMIKNLRAYRDRLGHRTIRAMIYTWAPPPKGGLTGRAGTEHGGQDQNDSAGYAGSVAKKLGVSVDQVIDIERYEIAHALCEAITRVECGGMPYSGNEIEDGLRLAGIVKPVTVGNSSTMKAGIAAGSGIAVNQTVTQLQGTITEVVAVAAPAAADSGLITGLIIFLKLFGVLATVVGIGWMIHERIRRQKRDERVEANSEAHAVFTVEPGLTPEDVERAKADGIDPLPA